MERAGFLKEAAGRWLEQGKPLLKRGEPGCLHDHPDPRTADEEAEILELLDDLEGGGRRDLQFLCQGAHRREEVALPKLPIRQRPVGRFHDLVGNRFPISKLEGKRKHRQVFLVLHTTCNTFKRILFPASHPALPPCIFRAVNPALETLLLPFSRGDLPIPARTLFLGAEPHPDLKDWPSVTGWQPLFPLAEAWRKAAYPLVEKPSGTWPLVLLLPGKSKDEALASFAKAHDLLEDGGVLVVAMPNTGGAARFEKELAEAAGGIASISKNKCRAFYAAKSPAWNQSLLSEWRALGEPRVLESTGFIVEAGIFSSDHVDPGSALLAGHLPSNLKGTAADLGAGWGYLSHALLGKNPKLKTLHLFEADARALACAKQNLASVETPLEFHWADVAAGLPGKYEVIVMNPPFHSGQLTDISLGRAFLRVAAESLRTGGRLFLVANRQLPYEAELDSLGLVWKKPVEDATYKLLFAEKRLGTSAPVTFR